MNTRPLRVPRLRIQGLFLIFNCGSTVFLVSHDSLIVTGSHGYMTHGYSKAEKTWLLVLDYTGLCGIIQKTGYENKKEVLVGYC